MQRNSFIKHLRIDITKKSFACLHPNLGFDDASITFNMARGMENVSSFSYKNFGFIQVEKYYVNLL